MLTKRQRAIRDNKKKEAMRVILRKYDLEDDLDKVWALGVHRLRGIPCMTEEDVINCKLKGTLDEYKHIYTQEKASNKDL